MSRGTAADLSAKGLVEYAPGKFASAKEAARILANKAAMEKGVPKPRRSKADDRGEGESATVASAAKPKKRNRHEESDMQKTCVRWFRLQYKRELLLSFPNGSKLAGDRKQQVIQRGIMKAEGMMPGAADLILIHDDGVVFLEAKTKTGTQSDSQKLFEAMVVAMGYDYLIFRSFDEFKKLVEQILKP